MAGFDVNGKPINAAVRVTAKRTTSGTISVQQGPIKVERTPGNHQQWIEAFGNGADVWEELRAQKSERSRENSDLLKELQTGVPDVKRFTELAGKWFPKTVGGDTDIVLFERGTVHWIERKPICGN